MCHFHANWSKFACLVVLFHSVCTTFMQTEASLPVWWCYSTVYVPLSCKLKQVCLFGGAIPQCMCLGPLHVFFVLWDTCLCVWFFFILGDKCFVNSVTYVLFILLGTCFDMFLVFVYSARHLFCIFCETFCLFCETPVLFILWDILFILRDTCLFILWGIFFILRDTCFVYFFNHFFYSARHVFCLICEAFFSNSARHVFCLFCEAFFSARHVFCSFCEAFFFLWHMFWLFCETCFDYFHSRDT